MQDSRGRVLMQSDVASNFVNDYHRLGCAVLTHERVQNELI